MNDWIVLYHPAQDEICMTHWAVDLWIKLECGWLILGEL